MISGIKRKTTAVESTQRFFQTVNLIISHFKRDADKEKIYELLSEDSTLNDLLIATAAVHIYHNLGIRVKDALELSGVSVESTGKLELIEKKSIYEEVETLLKDSFKLETDMLCRNIDLDNMIISYLIEEREIKLQDFEKERKIKEIGDLIEKNLIDIILHYPSFYFYDLIGDFLGYTDELKFDILEESSAFKDLSVEIEKKLEMEEKEDKFIELASLSRLIKKIQHNFEFKSYTELQTQTMPVRMIKRKILDYNFNLFPISIPGLKTFQEANNLKKDLIKKIEVGLSEKTDYEEFEKNQMSFLKNEIIKQLKTNPNDFLYFLESLNDSSFKEIIFMLNKYGVYNILQILNIDEEMVEKVKENMVRYNIDKFDIMNLNDQKKNLLVLLRKEICKLDFPELNKVVEDCEDLTEFDIVAILNQDKVDLKDFWRTIEQKTERPMTDFREFIRKKGAIDKIFLQNLGLNSYSQILAILNFEDIINNIVKDTFYYIFSKILRQLSRIIELYLKVSNDKALFLVALKKMYGTTESEKWVWIKLEELLIERLISRQKELVVVFNAGNQPFIVNGFIYARMTDKSLNDGIAELKDEVSPIYEDVAPLSLRSDLISSVSYCIGYDLIKRFESHEELRRLKVEERIETKEKVEEEKKKKLREQQEISTLNWIERRITSSLMRITSPGINPNQLYWQDKDLKIATDNLKLHSELKGNVIDLFCQYFNFATEKIKSLAEDMIIPPYEKLKNVVENLTEKVLQKRLDHSPSPEEINGMLDGERFEISKQIATRIGKILDKALYTKFKSKRRNG